MRIEKRDLIFIIKTLTVCILGLGITAFLMLYPIKQQEHRISSPCPLKKGSHTFPGYLSVGGHKRFLKSCIDLISNNEIPTAKRKKDSAAVEFFLVPEITNQSQIKGGKIYFLYSDINYIKSRGAGYESPQVKINGVSIPFEKPDRGTCRSDYSNSIPKEALKPGKNLFEITSGKYQNQPDTWAVENLTIEYYFSDENCKE